VYSPEVVTDPLLFVLGALHGLQPDHAVAAMGVASRSGTRAWRQALRVAAGHTAALGAAAIALQGLPGAVVRWIEPVAGTTTAAALLLLGLTSLVQLLRSRFVVHDHDHARPHVHTVEATARHTHGWGFSALALGVVLGLGGARSAGVLSLASGGHLVVGLVLYGIGLAVTSAAASGAFDLLRATADRHGHARLADVLAASGSVVAGGWMLAGLVR